MNSQIVMNQLFCDTFLKIIDEWFGRDIIKNYFSCEPINSVLIPFADRRAIKFEWYQPVNE